VDLNPDFKELLREFAAADVFIIDREQLIALKKARGRPQNLEDARVLEASK
jgi:hypothetical protein